MIIVRTSGGLGNQMFQYATGRALAVKNGVPLGIDNYMQQYLFTHKPQLVSIVFRQYELDQFMIDAQIVNKKEIPWYIRFYGLGRIEPYIDGLRRRLISYKGREKGSAQVYDETITTLGPNAYLDGNWQSYKYFESITQVLRKDFTIKKTPAKNIIDLAEKIKSNHSVCVHVRRGDYVGNAFHGLKNQAYYDTALTKIKDKHPIDTIYIFSDDIAWCKENLSFDQETIFVGTEYAGEHQLGHFYLMTCCKDFIIANSSFSWWAAWLAENSEKIVVAPEKWFEDTNISTKDLIPPDWIRV